MPRVWNKRDPNTPKDAVYVGRPSKWGNKHPIGWCDLCGQTHDRDAAIRNHTYDLLDLETRLRIKDELCGKDLVCWCAPKPCHADILLEIANA